MTMAYGDHIRVWRGPYWHHGVDLGDGTVVHYDGYGDLASKLTAEVRRSSIQDFAAGTGVEIVQHTNRLTPIVTVNLALSRVGERRYHLVTNNCEHFAEWCLTGQSNSAQVKAASGVLVLLLVVGIAGLVA